MHHIAEGTLLPSHVTFDAQATVCKYLVPEGYPESPLAGNPITLGPHNNALLYYANVEKRLGDLVTMTSRTLAFVGIGETLEHAEQAAEQAASEVKGPVRHRRDIGTRELLDRRVAHMKELQ